MQALTRPKAQVPVTQVRTMWAMRVRATQAQAPMWTPCSSRLR
jgi:hypothetical protein